MLRGPVVDSRSSRQDYEPRPSKRRHSNWHTYLLLAVVLFLGVTYLDRLINPPTIEEAIVNQLKFDKNFALAEKYTVADAVKEQINGINGTVTANMETTFTVEDKSLVMGVFVPVTNVYSPLQQITSQELAQRPPAIWHEINNKARAAIAEAFNTEVSLLTTLNSVDELNNGEIAIIPADLLAFNIKLLAFNGSYYLDEFQKGAIFRSVTFSGGSAADFGVLVFDDLLSKSTVLKVNQTGVAALTRVMMKRLNQVSDPLYFSKNIGSFLADADITHVSNEVSFKDDCAYSATVFCSDPRFIETLKDSGVDLVELTGNHNNDTGRANNASTINLYHSLGWQTIGGGLNAEEAAKFYVADQKQSKVAFLAYNYADSPNGGAIAGSSSAGANSFNFDDIKVDVESAKQQADFIIVDVQYWECYAYPDGYVEYPKCDKPIGNQESVFKKLIDLGADMVVGTQAHQPQTYELYNGKPIYYGLGNLYFDQTQWPGTERGIVLTHYFASGRLIQTKLSPTVYGATLQTTLMDDAAAVSLLNRLNAAR